MSEQRDLARFGAIVRKRRESLGLQQEDMRDKGGPSSTTMSGIERGVTEPSRSTLRKLDTGLKWMPGSAATAIAGGMPNELILDEPSPAAPAPPASDPSEDVPDLIDFANRLVEAGSLLARVSTTQELARVLHPAVRYVALAATTIGRNIRNEDGIMNDPARGAAEWLAVYAEQLRDLASISERVAAMVAATSTVPEGERHVLEAAPQPDASAEAVKDQEASADAMQAALPAGPIAPGGIAFDEEHLRKRQS